MSGGPTIQARGTATGHLGNMRPDLSITKTLNKRSGMIAFVSAQGRRGDTLAGLSVQHPLSRVSFGSAGGRLQPQLHTQPMPILHQDMPGETQLGFLAFALARQPGLRIGG